MAFIYAASNGYGNGRVFASLAHKVSLAILHSVKEGKANKNGLIYDNTGNSVRALYDPWGGGFNVIIDADYDEKVKPSPAAGTAPTLNGRRAAVWSNGADGVRGTGGLASDDVKTW